MNVYKNVIESFQVNKYWFGPAGERAEKQTTMRVQVSRRGWPWQSSAHVSRRGLAMAEW